MNRKKYRITIKMVKVIIMDHEQVSMEQAKEDIKRLINNSSKESLNQMFSSEPNFIYKISKLI